MVLTRCFRSKRHIHGLVLVFIEPPSRRHLPAMLSDQFICIEVSYPRADELEYIAREQLALMRETTVHSM